MLSSVTVSLVLILRLQERAFSHYVTLTKLFNLPKPFIPYVLVGDYIYLDGGDLVAKSCPTPVTLWTQAPLSMGFPWQKYWRGLPFPSPGDLPNPGIKPRCPALQADSVPSEPPGKPFLGYAYAQISGLNIFCCL